MIKQLAIDKALATQLTKPHNNQCGADGLEPSICDLEGRCSTVELVPLVESFLDVTIRIFARQFEPTSKKLALLSILVA